MWQTQLVKKSRWRPQCEHIVIGKTVTNQQQPSQTTLTDTLLITNRHYKRHGEGKTARGLRRKRKARVQIEKQHEVSSQSINRARASWQISRHNELRNWKLKLQLVWFAVCKFRNTAAVCSILSSSTDSPDSLHQGRWDAYSAELCEWLSITFEIFQSLSLSRRALK